MRISAARDFRTQKEERRARSMKKDSDDHDGKMLTHQMFRRQAHGTQGSRVESREVKSPGTRGVDRDRDRDCDYAAQNACAR